MANHNHKGRSKNGLRYVGLPHYLMQSPAYRALSTNARALYCEFLFRYNGGNNGDIIMSVRMAANWIDCASNTAVKAIGELQVNGFIKLKSKGSFTFKHRHASEWISTLHEYNGSSPTKDFMAWRKG
ncbi:MAG: hypothetical protein JKY84_00745 [Emcibacteraceae bacterium]|nr:hypothetical protein [Emcibacteraceae bacterium]